MGTDLQQLTIQTVVDKETYWLLSELRKEVFEQECCVTHKRLEFATPPDALHLIARLGPDGPVVAGLSVVCTTDHQKLHDSHRLVLPPHARVVRYTQLAVLKKFRGLNLPLMMILEANAIFTSPLGFTHSWLALPVRRALPSFVRLLGFQKVGEPVLTDQGMSWSLLKKEQLDAQESLNASLNQAYCPVAPAPVSGGLQQRIHSTI